MDEWDTVLDVEQNAVQAGSSEGTAAGAAQGRFDGFYAGAMKGVEVGAELGSYQGFAARLLDPKHAGDVKPRHALACLASPRSLHVRGGRLVVGWPVAGGRAAVACGRGARRR